MRTCLLAFLGLFLLGSPDQKPQEKKLGPEWTKVRPEGVYERLIQTKASCSSKGDSIHYSLITLGKMEVDVSESDDGHSYHVGIDTEKAQLPGAPARRFGRKAGAVTQVEEFEPSPRIGRPSISVKADEHGRMVQYVVTLGDVTHYDFNGDGSIDALYDRNRSGSRARIFYQDRWVDVRMYMNTFAARTATSPDGKITYHFENGAWKAK